MTHHPHAHETQHTHSNRNIRQPLLALAGLIAVCLVPPQTCRADPPTDPHLAHIRALVSALSAADAASPSPTARATAPSQAAPQPATLPPARTHGSLRRDTFSVDAPDARTSDAIEGAPAGRARAVTRGARKPAAAAAAAAPAPEAPSDHPAVSDVDPAGGAAGDFGAEQAAPSDAIHVHMLPIRTLCRDLPPALGLRITSELREAIGRSHRYALAPMPSGADDSQMVPCRPASGRQGRRCVGISAELVRRAEFGPNQVLEVSEKRVNLYYDHRRYEVGLAVRVIDLGSSQVMSSAFLGDLIRSKDLRAFHTPTHRPYAIDPPADLGGDLEEHAQVIAGRMLDLLDVAVAAQPPTVVRPTAVDAHVILVTRASAIVSAGQEDGLVPGDVLRVYRPLRPLIDTFTGELLGDREAYVGDLQVTTVSDQTSTGTAVHRARFQRGDAVRR